jgi:hypothetical protein
MRVSHSSKAKAEKADEEIFRAIESIPESYLRRTVEANSIPRHFHTQPRNNQLVAEAIAREFQSFGCEVRFQGACRNVVAFPSLGNNRAVTLIGAH